MQQKREVLKETLQDSSNMGEDLLPSKTINPGTKPKLQEWLKNNINTLKQPSQGPDFN